MGAGWVGWSAAPLADSSGTHPRMWRISQGSSWELASVPGHQRGMYRSTQNPGGCRKEGEGGDWAGPGLHPRQQVGQGGPKQGSNPPSARLFRTEGWHQRLLESAAAHPWPAEAERTENHADSPCCCSVYPRQGRKNPKKHSGWVLGRGDRIRA